MSSSLEIQPRELCPSPHEGTADTLATLNKKIDYGMGLFLSSKHLKYLQRACFASRSIPSISQTDTQANFTPMFLNVEVKRHFTDIDPKIQLAVWITAEFKKRALEGYDRSMPVLAAAITGDSWELWIVHERDWATEMVEAVVCYPSFLKPKQVLTISADVSGSVGHGKHDRCAWHFQNPTPTGCHCHMGPDRILYLVP